MATTIQNGVLNLDGAIQLRGGTYENLAAANPLLAAREIMVETDTGKLKVGDGVNNWNDLEYAVGDIPSETWEFELEDGTTVTRQVSSWTSGT